MTKPIKKNNLQSIRERKGFTREGAAVKLNTSATQIYRLEKGLRKLDENWLSKFSELYFCRQSEILGEDNKQPQIPLVGYVGTGAEIFQQGNLVQGEILEMLDMPITSRVDIPAREIIAVRVKGDSMLPVIHDGWILYYHAVNSIERCLRKLCVVKIKNGACYVKELRNGTKANHYMLLSSNANPVEDVQIEWAYPIISIEPR